MASTEKKGLRRPYLRFKYSQEDMEKALAAARSGMSISAAAATYNVPKSTLHGRVICNVPEERKMGPNSILTDVEEDRLEKWILGKAQVGFPMHPDEVKDAVQRVINEIPRKNPFTNNRPGEKWMALFLKRHPEVRKKHTDIISKARACVTEEGLRQWFADVRVFLKENHTLAILNRPRSIFNGDETGVQTCPKSGLLLGAKSEKNFYEIANGKEKECITTVLCTFSANGEVVPPMIVFPYKRIPVHIAQSVPDDWPIGRSDSGWMVQATFYDYVANIFHPWCVKNDVEFPVLYFLDGHKSHISSELQEFCVAHDIILYCLPPNSTHIMQPCDVTIFKPLKCHWRKVVNEHKQQTQKAITKVNFAPLFKKAFDRLSINVETIKNGFRTCGLYPFDEDAVDYNKCISTRRKNLRQESQESAISMEDYASTKKVIDHFVGSTKAVSFVQMRKTNRIENSDDRLYALWRLCTDYVEGTRILSDEERIPEVLTEVQQNNNLIEAAAVPENVEDISFPVEEIIDANSGMPVYSIVIDHYTEQDHLEEERTMIDNEYSRFQRYGSLNSLNENCGSIYINDNGAKLEIHNAQRVSDESLNIINKFDELVFDIEHPQVVEDSVEKKSVTIDKDSPLFPNEIPNIPLDENKTTFGLEHVPDMLPEENNNFIPMCQNLNEKTRVRSDENHIKIAEAFAPQEKISSEISFKSSTRQHLEETWEKNLKWPEFEKKESKKDKKDKQDDAAGSGKSSIKKKDLPFSITSIEWKKYYETVKKEQEEKERKAAERAIMLKIKKEFVENEKLERAKARAEKAKQKAEEIEEKAKQRAEKAKQKEKEKLTREQTKKPATRQRARKTADPPN